MDKTCETCDRLQHIIDRAAAQDYTDKVIRATEALEQHIRNEHVPESKVGAVLAEPKNSVGN